MERINQHKEPLLGKNIRRIRLSRNIRSKNIVIQLQLHGVEICRTTYSKVEMGISNPSVPLIIALKEIFNCDYAEFFEKIEND